MDNKCGSFVGLLDLKAYVDKHEVDISGVNKRPPFELELMGWKHLVSEGKDAGLDIPITRVSYYSFISHEHSHSFMLVYYHYPIFGCLGIAVFAGVRIFQGLQVEGSAF